MLICPFRTINQNNGTKVGPVYERSPEMRKGMLVIKNHVSLPNSGRWTQVCDNGSNSGKVRPSMSN
ncbi:17591_t:CDS:2, partial [Racocetra fulgida]